MGSWNDVSLQLSQAIASDPDALDKLIVRYIKDVARIRDREVICYYSGWLQRGGDLSVSVVDDDMNGLMNANYGLDTSKGLDLILHTPGGDVAATEAMVGYLRNRFEGDIVAIVPQLAMSAGTMVCCGCREVIMGAQSSLGPTDPQLNGVAAAGVIEEFEDAVKAVSENPASGVLWAQIIGKYPPTYLGDCQKVLDSSKNIVVRWLSEGMFAGDPDGIEKADELGGFLCSHNDSAMHNRHFSAEDVAGHGMRVSMLEDDQQLQDAVLSLHHAFMLAFQQNPITKVVWSSSGGRWIQQSAPS